MLASMTENESYDKEDKISVLYDLSQNAQGSFVLSLME